MSFLHWLKYLPTPKKGRCHECSLVDASIVENEAGGFSYICADCQIIKAAQDLLWMRERAKEKAERLKTAKKILRKKK